MSFPEFDDFQRLHVPSPLPEPTPPEVARLYPAPSGGSDDPRTMAYAPETGASQAAQPLIIEGLGYVVAADNAPDNDASNTVVNAMPEQQDAKEHSSADALTPADPRTHTLETLAFVTIPWHRDTIRGSNPASIIIPDRQQDTDYGGIPDDMRLPVYTEEVTHWVPAKLVKTALAFNDDPGRGGDLAHDCTVFAYAATADERVVKKVMDTSFNGMRGNTVLGDIDNHTQLSVDEMEQRGLDAPVGSVFVLSDNEDPDRLYHSNYHFVVKASDNPKTPLYVSKFGMNLAGFHDLKAAAVYYKAKSMGSVTNLRTSMPIKRHRYL